MLHRVIREDVDLVVAAAAQPATVWVDHGQLEQVLVNLAVNGRDAMPDGGRLTVRTAYVKLAPATAAQLGIDDTAYQDTGGGFVVLTVTDTGVGMPAEVTARVFEPFFTTKEPGKGNGLGLSTAYGIVRHAGGQIVVDSTPGVGSTFRVYLPA
nr:ATP-binding protein [Micromonospora sp. DSM 115978]